MSPTLAVAALLCSTFIDGPAGRWSGRFEPPRLSAQVELELTPTQQGWRGSLAFCAGPDSAQLPVEDLAVSDSEVSFATRIEGASVRVELLLEDGLLLGTLEAVEDGRVLAQGPAGLARAGDAEASERLTRWLDSLADPIDAEGRARVIDRALSLLEELYVSPDRARAAVQVVRELQRSGAYEAVAAAARFAELLGRDLGRATGDRHVQVRLAAAPVLDPRLAGEPTAEDHERDRAEAQAEGFGVGEVTRLEEGIGYLEMRRFVRAELAGDALASAFARLGGSRALVIDLRACRGGDPDTVLLLASWLFDGTPRHWSDFERRFDGTKRQMWTYAWLPGPRLAEVPVYVLTSARTFSAPEGLAYGLQQLGRATIVGERTGGGAHSGAWFPLDDRFALFVPLSRSRSAVGGGDWEGVGVTPDVACSASDALQVALHQARQRLGSAGTYR